MIDDKVPLKIEQAEELYQMGARFGIINKLAPGSLHQQTIDKLRQAVTSKKEEIALELDKTDLYNALVWFELRENKAKNDDQLLWYLQFFARLRFGIDLKQIYDTRRSMFSMNSYKKWY